jgi:AcrR family transcriptional regulator
MESGAVPDALAAYLPPNLAAAGRVAQRAKRAEVLAATRRRIAQFGPEKVTLRMLASDCDTSVQTIFNLVGNRRDVLEAAIIDHANALIAAARGAPAYPTSSNALVDAIWWCSVRNPDYARHLARAYAARRDDRWLITIRENCTRFIVDSLRRLGAELRPLVEPRDVAGCLELTTGATCLEWANDGFETSEFRAVLQRRAALLLLGALKPEPAQKIETWLESGWARTD